VHPPSSKTAIIAQGLSKRYWIGGREAQHDTLTSAVRAWARKPLANFSRIRRLADTSADNERDVLWAVRDVSFEMKHGEAIGIIGRNGMGKSTLLKLLSRITEPTRGTAYIYGRVASLLEVGTGFHPDLTGRENVYLNGTVLGMRKAEIDQRFEEIVEFAGVARFIDTPIKRYSSGMQVRLAFSVAAHLEPEILIIDEVLAVGDLAFQKKCLGKMENVAHEGRTILFVSHNMQMVDALCPRSIMLQNGEVVADGPTKDVVTLYHESLREVKVELTVALDNHAYRRGSGAVRFSGITVRDSAGSERHRFHTGEPVRFDIAYEVLEDVADLHLDMLFRSGTTREFLTVAEHALSTRGLRRGEKGTCTVVIPELHLRSGTYPLYFWLGDGYGRSYDVIDDLTLPLSVYSVDEERSAGAIRMVTRLVSAESAGAAAF
jgi:lipopolysaccharide transport system ATP-binding protein